MFLSSSPSPSPPLSLSLSNFLSSGSPLIGKDSWASKMTLTGSSKIRPLANLSAASSKKIVASDDDVVVVAVVVVIATAVVVVVEVLVQVGL
jgi:hypothetical protein